MWPNVNTFVSQWNTLNKSKVLNTSKRHCDVYREDKKGSLRRSEGCLISQEWNKVCLKNVIKITKIYYMRSLEAVKKLGRERFSLDFSEISKSPGHPQTSCGRWGWPGDFERSKKIG